jgi:methylase of polypeptide subunit release factors
MLTLLLDNRLYLSPIDEHCHRVIDLGCGTGIWTLDFADMHPSAEVVGVDLSPSDRIGVDSVELDWTGLDLDGVD